MHLMLSFVFAIVVVVTDCQTFESTATYIDAQRNEGDSRNDRLRSVEQLLMEMRTEMQQQRETMKMLSDQQQVHREMIGDLTEVINRSDEENRHGIRLLNQTFELSEKQNKHATTTLLKLEQQSSYNQQTVKKLEVVEKMLQKMNETSGCEANDNLSDTEAELNKSTQWMLSRLDRLITTSGRRKLISSEY
jgi:septal ring factor EnvC (AmiA/AmiB activator)